MTRKEDLICGREPAAGVGVGRAAADLGYAVERRGEKWRTTPATVLTATGARRPRFRRSMPSTASFRSGVLNSSAATTDTSATSTRNSSWIIAASVVLLIRSWAPIRRDLGGVLGVGGWLEPRRRGANFQFSFICLHFLPFHPPWTNGRMI